MNFAQGGQAHTDAAARVQAFIDSDPQIQAWKANPSSAIPGANFFVGPQAQQMVEARLKAAGIEVPDGFVLGGDTNVTKDAGFDWKPILGMGALVSGGLLGPALLGGGAGASAAGAGGAGAAGGAGEFAALGGTMGLPAGLSTGAVSGVGAGAGAAGTAGSILGGASKVGSILGKAENIGKTLSPILGGAAAGAQQGQQANDLLQLRGAQLGLEAPQQRLNTSVRASIAANAKPIQITSGPSPFAHAPAGSTMIHYTNSLGPQDISPNTRALAQNIIAQQLQEQMSPNHGLPTVGQGSTAGNILGGAALGSGILGGLSTLRGQGASQPPINIDPGQFIDPGILNDPSRDFIDPGILS
jgi:hypothetical protein